MPGKDAVIITPYRDGPLLVRGPVELMWPDGSPIACDRDPVALCRCGKSRLRPFCDGTHKLIGFRAPGQSVERAAGGSVEGTAGQNVEGAAGGRVGPT